MRPRGAVEKERPLLQFPEVQRRVLRRARTSSRPVGIQPDSHLVSGQATDRDVDRLGFREGLVR